MLIEQKSGPILVNENSLPVAVIMQRTTVAGRWSTVKWETQGVVQDNSEPGTSSRVIYDDETRRLILYPGFDIVLFREEVEDYYLNLTAREPRIFVLWRQEEPEPAVPAFVSVSYGKAARWMDAGENVDGVPMAPEVYAWVGQFVEQHYRPQPKVKRRRN